MKANLIVIVLVIIALALSASSLTSCGSEFNLGSEYGNDLWGNDVFLTDGDRRGDYIYYHGTWHYRGFGTPYYWYNY